MNGPAEQKVEPKTVARLLSYWLPVLIWAALLFTLSTDTFSSSHTGSIILALLQRLLPGTNENTLDLLHLLIRKSAHLTEYFFLGLLLLRAVRGEQHGWKLRWAILALAIACAYAGLDEFHQSFVPSRTASPWDVLLDTAGAAIAQAVAWRRLDTKIPKTEDATNSPS